MPSRQIADPFATLQALPTDDAAPTELVAILRKIERHLAVIAAAGHLQGPGRPIADADANALSLYLPALGEGLGPDGRSFNAAEALAYLQQHVGSIGVSAKGLGKLFARCLGVPVAGFRIRRDGSMRGAVVWRIWRV